MPVTIGDLSPWEREGISEFEWGRKKRQKSAEARFGRGGKYPQKFGESEERYWQKRSLVSGVLDRAAKFLLLKDRNSVRILFKFDLEGVLADTYPLPSPALVRVRISRIAGRRQAPHYQWRAADAVAEASSQNDGLTAITSELVGPGHNSVAAFLESHFGVNLDPHISHYPEVASIQARMVLSESFGALAVLAGDSRKIPFDSERNVIESWKGFTYVTDDASLDEV